MKQHLVCILFGTSCATLDVAQIWPTPGVGQIEPKQKPPLHLCKGGVVFVLALCSCYVHCSWSLLTISNFESNFIANFQFFKCNANEWCWMKEEVLFFAFARNESESWIFESFYCTLHVIFQFIIWESDSLLYLIYCRNLSYKQFFVKQCKIALWKIIFVVLSANEKSRY